MNNDDYEEINLLDYVKIIIKRWRIIVVATLIIMLVALGWTIFLSPKIYESNGLIKIGQVSGNIIEPVEQTVTLTLTENTAKQILEQIQPKELKEQFPITKAQIQDFLKRIEVNKSKTKKPKREAAVPENFLHLSYQDVVPMHAKQVVEILQNLILEEHQKQYDLKIKARDKTLSQKEKELEKAQTHLQASDQLVKKLENSLAIYPTTYSRGSGEALAKEIATRDSLRSQTTALEADILNRKLSQVYDKMSQIISAPLLPDTPTKYQRLSITLAIAAILGVFIGILGAFGWEWWEQNKNKISNF